MLKNTKKNIIGALIILGLIILTWCMLHDGSSSSLDARHNSKTVDSITRNIKR